MPSKVKVPAVVELMQRICREQKCRVEQSNGDTVYTDTYDDELISTDGEVQRDGNEIVVKTPFTYVIVFEDRLKSTPLRVILTKNAKKDEVLAELPERVPVAAG